MLYLIFCVIWAVVCGQMAKDRNREVLLGYIAGFCFGLIAVLYYYVTGERQ